MVEVGGGGDECKIQDCVILGQVNGVLLFKISSRPGGAMSLWVQGLARTKNKDKILMPLFGMGIEKLQTHHFISGLRMEAALIPVMTSFIMIVNKLLGSKVEIFLTSRLQNLMPHHATQ